jgi:tetratricopeptide (TPR) repeat protein
VTTGETGETTGTPTQGSSLALLRLLPLVVLVVALAARATSVQEALLRNATNTRLLGHTMAAVAGQDVPAPAELPRLRLATGLDGTQSRALARIAAEQGRPDEAALWLAAGLSDPTTEPLTRFELCRLHLSQGRPGAARETCAGSVISAPFWLARGIEASDAGRGGEAVDYFDLARATDPNLLEAWARLGDALYAQGRLVEAVPVLERLVAVQAASSAERYHQLAEAYTAAGRAADAVALMEHALRQYPTERELYLGMAAAQRAGGDLAAADAWYGRMLERWPQDAFGWAARAELAVARKDFEDAVAHYRQAVRFQPESTAYWKDLAGAAASGGDQALAAEAYITALRLDPGDAEVWTKAGRALAASERVDEARAAFRQALAIQPDNQEAQELLVGLDTSPAAP